MLRSIFVFSLLSAAVIGGLWSRYLALLAYVWFALFRPQEWMWYDISALRPSLFLGLMVVLPALVTGVMPNLTHSISAGSALFLLLALASQFTAVAPEVGWAAIDAHARLVIVSLFAVTLLNSRERMVGFVVVVAASFGFHTAKAGLASVIGGGVRFSAGLGGAFTDNNGYALGAVMIAPFLLCAHQLLKGGGAIRSAASAGFLVAVPLTAVMIVSTMSRGALVGLAVSVATFVGLQRNRVTPMIVLAMFLSFGLPFVPTPKGFAERMQTITNYEDQGDGSALGRIHFWRVARIMASDYPLGVGLGGYMDAYDRYDFSDGRFGRRRAVHSSHFQVLADLGYGGALLWTGLLSLTFVNAFRVRRFARDSRLAPQDAALYRVTAEAVIVSTTGFIAGGAFLSAAMNDLTWYTFAIAAALDRLSKSQARQWALEPPTAVQPVPVNVTVPRAAARRRATA